MSVISRLTDTEAARLATTLEAKFAGQIAAESEFMKEVLAETIAYLRREITNEISEAVGQLRADMAQRGVDRSEVVELPNVLRKQS